MQIFSRGSVLISVALVPLLAALSSPATAAPAPVVDAVVVDALREARQSSGVAAYGALRRLWRRWDQTDPTFIEEGFTLIEQDAQVAPPLRVYAGLLGAYARRRRGDLEGAKRKVQELGYVSSWLLVGPFDNETKASLFTPFGPEEHLSGLLPPPGHQYEGKTRPVGWRALSSASPYGWLDLGAFLRPAEKSCAYASTFVRAVVPPAAGQQATPRQGERPATVWIGASGAWRAFWNGREVLADDAYRSLDPDRLAARVIVKENWNRLTIKICGDEEGPMVQVRLADAKGAPDPSLETSNDRELGAQAGRNTVAANAKDTISRSNEGVKVLTPGTIEIPAKRKGPTPAGGPLASLANAVSNKNTRAETLEAFARYLASTGGDDRKEHLARDLAQRAAQLGPTGPRLLLAAELADDHNEKGAWLQRAHARIRPPEDDTELLLAEAAHARAGSNARDAIPYFESLLARDPNNVAALVARAELYEEAGLRRTALATLESAVDRRPHAVALLRLLAHELRATGRIADAEDVERRYAARRFDDPTFLRGRLELAVALRDREATAHWTQRMLAVEPDASPVLEAVVRAARSLGDTPQALTLLRQQLDKVPEDIDALRLLADIHGEEGRRAEQLNLLRRILVLQPQAKDIRDYVEQAGPIRVRPDESYAWNREQILSASRAPSPGGFAKRTLRDLHVTTMYPNGLASRFSQVVFQPLTDEGAAAARQYAFSFQAGREMVEVRAARVFRANGKTDESVETGEAPADNPALATYSSTRNFYVQLPRLAAGDVVEIRYRVEEVTPRNEFGDSFSETTYLQSFDPTASSEYVLVAPKAKKVGVRVHGSVPVKREDRDEGDAHVVRLVAANVPPLIPEAHMPPLPEVATSVIASTFVHWDDVGRWFWGLARDQFNVDDDVRRRTKEIVKGRASNEERVRAIYDYIVQRTRYVALEFGIEGFRPRPAAQTLARGWGDCKDKATAIVTMLREVGIPAHVVLVRTGARGDAPTDTPSYAFFDHAIAYVPELDLYLDGTAEYTGSRELPAMDRGAIALQILDEGKTKLVRLPEPSADATLRTRRIQVRWHEGGAADVDLRLDATGALAAQFRQRYHADSTRHGRVQEDLGREFGGLALREGTSGLSTNDLEDVERPVSLHLQGNGLGLVKNAAGIYTVSIAAVGHLTSRYAATSRRQYPVRLPFAASYDEEWQVQIPSGYTVKAQPGTHTLTSPFGKLDLSTVMGATQTNQITVRARLRLEQTRIAPSAYPAFRAFCEEADRLLGESIVLGKN